MAFEYSFANLKSPQSREIDTIQMIELILLSTTAKTAWINANWFQSYGHFS